MTSRIITKIGDIFEVPIDGNNKKYMQYIAVDRTQLNSSVIRVFRPAYPTDALLSADDITSGVVDFYAHTVLRFGIAAKIWRKVGKSPQIGSLKILFRGTFDVLEPRVKTSKNWHVWELNGPVQKVGELVGEYQKAEIGSVIPATYIAHRMRTGKYNFSYPSY